MSSKAGFLDFIVKIVVVIVCVLLLVNFFRSLTSHGQVSFYSLLESLQTAPTVDFTSFISNIYISSDWGLFNFFRDFLNVFVGLFQIIVFLVGNLINALMYILYFIRILLIA